MSSSNVINIFAMHFRHEFIQRNDIDANRNSSLLIKFIITMNSIYTVTWCEIDAKTGSETKPQSLGSPFTNLSSCIYSVLIRLRNMEIETGLYPTLKNRKVKEGIYRESAEMIANHLKNTGMNTATVYGSTNKYYKSTSKAFYDEVKYNLYKFLGITPSADLTELELEKLLTAEKNA